MPKPSEIDAVRSKLFGRGPWERFGYIGEPGLARVREQTGEDRVGRMQTRIIPSTEEDASLICLLRQFAERACDIIERQEAALKAVDWEGQAMNDLIQANRDTILQMHEEAARRIGKVLVGGGNQHDAEKLVYIGKVLHALSVFHPMHGESWCGWPEEGN